MENVPQTKVKAIRGIIELNDVDNIFTKTTSAKVTYSRHEKQSFLGRCIGSITGRNNRERIEASRNVAVAVEHLTSLMKQISDEVSRNGERILRNTNHIAINARAISALSNDFISLAERHDVLRSQFDALIMKQMEYNQVFQSAINSLEAQQYIDRLAESWEAGNVFVGYDKAIQAALFIDCIGVNWYDVLQKDSSRLQYIKDKTTNILVRLGIQESFKYKYGDFTLNGSDKLKEDLQICLPEFSKNNSGFLTYNAINNSIPTWFESKHLDTIATPKTLVHNLVKDLKKEIK